jgi:hypothetical protein
LVAGEEGEGPDDGPAAGRAISRSTSRASQDGQAGAAAGFPLTSISNVWEHLRQAYS